MVGICGGVPHKASRGDEILLGDVIVDTDAAQFNFKRQVSDGVV